MQNYGLTKREKDVLALIAQGLGNKELAAKLFIDRSTLATHIKRIYSKLFILSENKRVKAVNYYYNRGVECNDEIRTIRK